MDTGWHYDDHPRGLYRCYCLRRNFIEGILRYAPPIRLVTTSLALERRPPSDVRRLSLRHCGLDSRSTLFGPCSVPFRRLYSIFCPFVFCSIDVIYSALLNFAFLTSSPLPSPSYASVSLYSPSPLPAPSPLTWRTVPTRAPSHPGPVNGKALIASLRLGSPRSARRAWWRSIW